MQLRLADAVTREMSATLLTAGGRFDASRQAERWRCLERRQLPQEAAAHGGSAWQWRPSGRSSRQQAVPKRHRQVQRAACWQRHSSCPRRLSQQQQKRG